LKYRLMIEPIAALYGSPAGAACRAGENSGGLLFREKNDISVAGDAGAPCRGAIMLDRTITNGE
jgi:hypothetical protein